MWNNHTFKTPFPAPMLLSTYPLRTCFPVPKFPRTSFPVPMFPRTYISQYLNSQGPMFLSTAFSFQGAMFLSTAFSFQGPTFCRGPRALSVACVDPLLWLPFNWMFAWSNGNTQTYPKSNSQTYNCWTTTWTPLKLSMQVMGNTGIGKQRCNIDTWQHRYWKT